MIQTTKIIFLVFILSIQSCACNQPSKKVVMQDGSELCCSVLLYYCGSTLSCSDGAEYVCQTNYKIVGDCL